MAADKNTNGLKSRMAIIATLFTMTLLSGVVHGVLDGRWKTQQSKSDQAALLADLPTEFGPWRLLDNQELSESTQRLLRCHGSLVRIYENVDTGDTVNVAVLFGPRGPIAVHTPEVCYNSIGTRQSGPRAQKSIETKNDVHRFWSVNFMRDEETKPTLKVIYGWSDGGPWVAANHPRFWLTDDLYKIQLAGPITGSAVDPCDFVS